MKRLISLFIVISILLSLNLNTSLSYEQSTSKKRNIQRMLDLKALEKGLNSYYEKNNKFITSKTGGEDIINFYEDLKDWIDIKKFQDPLGNYYKYWSDWVSFQIWASLERNDLNWKETAYLVWNYKTNEYLFYIKNNKVYYKEKDKAKQSDFWLIRNYKNSNFNKLLDKNQEINWVVLKWYGHLPYKLEENQLLCTVFWDNLTNNNFIKNNTCEESINKLKDYNLKFYKKIVKDKNNKTHTQLFAFIYGKK